MPDAVPPGRAILAGTVETAVNAVWDARPRLGDRIAVIGAGMIGGSVAKLLAGFPAARVQLADVDPAAARLGVGFSPPEAALGDCDLVELSWYGDRPVAVPLGEHFHSRRLVIRGSQVGRVARPDRTHAERLGVAFDLLADPAFDALITGITVRDHVMVAHSFRGAVFRPAQCLHGATFVVDATFRRPRSPGSTRPRSSCRR